MNLFTVFTWNIEGLRRNIRNLQHHIMSHSPDLIILCEPQMYQCDLKDTMKILDSDYCYSLNSADKYEPDLPLVKSNTTGGAMIIWETNWG